VHARARPFEPSAHAAVTAVLAPEPALAFDNRFVAELPGDPEDSPRRRQVVGAAWSPAAPTPVAAPRLVAHAREVAELVGFTDADVRAPWFAEVFGGNRLLPGMRPYAAAYGGHQFGHWAGQLGDGRAMTLGEVVNGRGERWELQLKGAGPTPTRAPPTGAPCCARRSASSCAARPCTTSACRRRGR
jgi:uncharacterized protein YdiU (UPF0061 family)